MCKKNPVVLFTHRCTVVIEFFACSDKALSNHFYDQMECVKDFKEPSGGVAPSADRWGMGCCSWLRAQRCFSLVFVFMEACRGCVSETAS